jgi:hypothetical protein
MKKYFVTTLTILTTLNVSAWTLGTQNGFKFNSPNVTFKIAGNNCTNAGLNASAVETLAKDGNDSYWATVPTTSLELTSGGVISSIDTSGDDLTAAANKGSDGNIVVGCSSNATLFSSAGTLAVGGIACNNGVCQGAVLLNDTASTTLDTLSREKLVATFAHELGHALGLGHSSAKSSLMYYSASNKVFKSLAQDDIDGITYLYPSEKKLSGLSGACGTIDTNSHGPANFIGSILLGLALIFVAKKYSKKSKVTA